MTGAIASHVGRILSVSLLLAGSHGCADAEEIPALDALPLWSAVPGVRIGAVDDPELSFARVTDLVIGPDSRVYSLHTSEPSIRRWTTDGQPMGRVGRRGTGPGEFEQPLTMAWRADSLWVLDVSGYRISFFDTLGASVRQITPLVDLSGPATGVENAYPARPAGYLADGSILAQTPGFSNEIAEGRLRELAFIRAGLDGGTPDTLAVLPIGKETILAVMMEGGGGTYTDQPYGDGVIGLPTADYGGLLILDPTAATSQEAAEFRLSRISMNGDTVFSRSYAYRPMAIDGAETDSLIASTAESLHGFVGDRTGTTLEQWTGWIDEAMYKPAFHPPVEAMIPGRDGSIWLSRNPVRNSEREWLVLSDNGQPLGQVRLPSGLRLMEASQDQVWGVETDELGVEYIVSYDIEEE